MELFDGVAVKLFVVRFFLGKLEPCLHLYFEF